MSDNPLSQYIIVGGGQSGGWAAKSLRDLGFAGRIVLFGDESHLPYERPPLSKEVLLTRKDPASCQLWDKDKFDQLDIDVQTRARVERIDRGAHKIFLQDGRACHYDRLLLATGARPRTINMPGAHLAGIHVLRTMDDCLAIKQSLEAPGTVLVVGGGWIGLEIAASARLLGSQVVLVEATSQLCGRVLPRQSATYFEKLHSSQGVEIRLSTHLLALEGGSRVESALLSDGTTVSVSAVIIGIGVVPNVELAVDSGLSVDNGILVDASCRTSDPDIFACGDVANQPFGNDGARIRLETWQNAQNQGIAAARGMLGLEAALPDTPWFWSDQYDLNFQMVGHPSAEDTIFVKGDVEDAKFVQYFVKDGSVKAAAAFNSPRELREARRIIQKQLPFDDTGFRTLST